MPDYKTQYFKLFARLCDIREMADRALAEAEEAMISGEPAPPIHLETKTGPEQLPRPEECTTDN